MISVIIPTYNSERYVGETIKSVLSQTYIDFEIIIVDNFSKDKTIAIVEGFHDPRIKIFQYQNNGVIAASRNNGILKSKGQYIALIDSDDTWLPNKLESCVKQLIYCDLVHHSMHSMGADGIELTQPLAARDVSKFSFNKLITSRNYIQNSSVVFKRELIQRHGLFSTDALMAGAEDFQYWLRLFKGCVRFKFINKQLGHYRVHCAGFSNRDMSIALNAVYTSFYNEISLYTKLRLSQIVAYNHLNFLLANGTVKPKNYLKALFPPTIITAKTLIKIFYVK